MEDLEEEAIIKKKEEEKEYSKEGKYSELFKLKVSDIVGLIPAKKRFGHPLHESDTDANFSLSKDGSIAHCWRHLVSLNAVQYLCIKAGYKTCVKCGTPHKGRGISKIKGDKEAYAIAYKEAVKLGLIQEYIPKETNVSVLTRRGQIESFWEEQPFFYDRSKLFWFWNKEETRWELSDEVDFLNSIQRHLGVETIDGKNKTELIEGFKQIGRLHIPKPVKESWIQFKDTIYDLKENTNFPANHEYFVTNPIPHNIGKSEDTQIIDKLFEDWVGKENKINLYEVLAFCLIPKYFIQRIICNYGGGGNGKGTFGKVLIKFIGQGNVTSTSLKKLMSGQFEITKLYKKLVCIIAETNVTRLSETEFLKSLSSGTDLIGGEFKNKNPFDFFNYAKLVMSANSLPISPDKTIGFTRRWFFNDFTKVFRKEKEVLDMIPEEEYENLSLKCFNIVKDLYEKKGFTNDGTFEERAKGYRERSNPIPLFIEKNCMRDKREFVSFGDFYDELIFYLSENKFMELGRNEVSRILREEGLNLKKTTKEGVNDTWIYGLKLIKSSPSEPSEPTTKLVSHSKSNSNHENLENLENSQRELDDVEVKKI